MFYPLLLQTINQDIELALILVFFVWLFAWTKGQLGDPKLAVIIAAIVAYLTVYSHPELIWIAVIILFFVTYGKGLLQAFGIEGKGK